MHVSQFLHQLYIHRLGIAMVCYRLLSWEELGN